MKKLKKNILILFMLLVAIVLGGSVEIPHERITENPKAEVSTVESKKLKENAKLNISVNKKDIEEISGYEENGKMVFILPEEKTKMIRDEEVIVVKSLSELPNTYQGTKKNRMGTTKKFPVTKDENKGLRTVTVDKQEEAKEYYIALVDKSTGTVNKVYKSGGSVRSEIIYLGPIGEATLMDTSMSMIGHARSDNRTVEPTKAGYEGMTIWKDELSTDSIGEGYFASPSSVAKAGYYKPFELKIMGELTFTFSVLGSGNGWGWNGARSGRNGGYIYWNTTYFTAPKNSARASDLWETRLYYFDEMIGNQEPIGGIYMKSDLRFYKTRSYDSGGNVYVPTRKSPVEYVMFIIKRDALKATIDIVPNDLTDGKISLGNMKFGKELGYQNIENRSKYEIIESNAGTGISIGGNTGQELVFAKDLKYGVYKIKMNWIGKDYSEFKYSIATGDEITINYNAVDIGEVNFVLDPRIKSDTSWNWINAKGNTGAAITSITAAVNYSKLMKIEGTLVNLASTNITDILSMEGRPNKNSDNKYIWFRTAPHIITDEVGMRYDINLNDLNKELVISKANSTNSQMLNNKFKLSGADGKVYLGSIREKYGPDKYYEGTATLDMTNHSVGEYSRWSPEATGNASSAPSIEPSMVEGILKLGGTKLIDSRGFDANSIITKLVVKQNGVTKESPSITNGKYQVIFSENVIGFDITTAQFFITKEKNSTKENTYEVIPYYNDVPLGKLTVKVINNIATNIGEVKFILDPRIKYNTSMNWINAKGDTGTEISTIASSTNYVGLRQIEGTFSNLSSTNITDILSIEGRPEKTTAGIYNTFRTSSGATTDEAGMKTGIALTNLLNELIISKNNSENPQMLDNKFELLGANGRVYAGNIKEEYGPYKYYEGTATLEMLDQPLESYSVWNPGVIGDAVSNSPTGSNIGVSILKLGPAKLFDSRGFGSGAIVTKLIVKQNGVKKEVTSIIGQTVEVKFPENTIGIGGSNGNLFISKQADSGKENTYEIIPYYNDIPLGKLTVKIINTKLTDIGEVKFILDPRIKSDTSMNWINAKGDTGTAISTIASSTNYIGLRQVEGTFSNLSSTNITDIISMEGRPEKYPNGIYNSFRTSPGETIDEAGMKTGVNLTNLLNELIISKNNSENPQMLNNKFELLGADGKGYVGNIKEEYGPDKY
ncbi:MAG: hypothetical protein ACRC6K_09440, partial [Fusobacteriaceae bacterium]